MSEKLPSNAPETPQTANSMQAGDDTTTQPEQAQNKPVLAATQTNLTKERTRKKKERHLSVLKEEGGNVTSACKKDGISRDTHYRWMHEDEDFRHKVWLIQDEINDALEQTAYSMAVVDRNPQVLLATLRAKAKDRGWGEDKAGVAVQVNAQVNNQQPTITAEQFIDIAHRTLEGKRAKPASEA
jgi:hypothetical protein